MSVIKIVSGGQTGADQGGLEAGKLLGLETGGWMPKGWKTEAGPRPDFEERYGMREHPTPLYPPRTEANVIISNATAWFGNLGSPGYRCTEKACKKHNRPFRVINSPQELRDFVAEFNVRILNVAGNRESKNPGIQWTTREAIVEALRGQVHAEALRDVDGDWLAGKP